VQDGAKNVQNRGWRCREGQKEVLKIERKGAEWREKGRDSQEEGQKEVYSPKKEAKILFSAHNRTKHTKRTYVTQYVH
jgi:hypothetical protein